MSPVERAELVALAMWTFEPNRSLFDSQDPYRREVQLAGWLEEFEAARRRTAWQRTHGAAA